MDIMYAAVDSRKVRCVATSTLTPSSSHSYFAFIKSRVKRVELRFYPVFHFA